ncbi:hypothetical protein M419DRAFT_121422 [Trichoderma reesei RUT C-30]|uniref:Uncharacterized protein n=1 Tax=Hypocrea jecorina (strain ATCC 56765 / BCRC 32924 / NRRL 11460 / Rut C-30) TaxID=1344414 RepID=A0A024SKC2_HYPJR|nr:hypothetical protein M419DRAFT_121422 [Trichoderma reesei RUT C-30]
MASRRYRDPFYFDVDVASYRCMAITVPNYCVFLILGKCKLVKQRGHSQVVAEECCVERLSPRIEMNVGRRAGD